MVLCRDQEEFHSVPDLFQSQVSMVLNGYQEKVNKMLTEYERKRSKFLHDVRETYAQFENAIPSAESKKSTLTLKIPGSYESIHQRPTLEHWYDCNTGKAMVIREVIKQCEERGYHPSVEISESQYESSDGEYTGGDMLIFTCSFNGQ